MSAYGPLARWYDGFTRDVPYDELAEFYEKLLNREGKESLTLLDLCCGTGSVTLRLARRGHELIGCDRSPEMLAVAAEKAESESLAVKPIFLCQAAEELDLYGTVNGACCCLDGVNYLPPENLGEVFRRLHLFIEPGGTFAFDIHSPEHLRELDGGVFVDENEDALCLWRGDFDEGENALYYGMDIFTASGRLWRRETEEHVEYAHSPEELCRLLRRSGFDAPEMIRDGVLSDMGRIFITAKNLGH